MNIKSLAYIMIHFRQQMRKSLPIARTKRRPITSQRRARRRSDGLFS